MQNLTGTWKCPDGGTYCIAQKNNNIYISGVKTKDNYFTISGFGVINPDTSSAVVYWSNMPTSSDDKPHGVEYLDLSHENKITKLQGTGFSFGNFTR